MFSGCGGSADSSSSENTSTDIPNNNPDTYNTAEVLEGHWDVIDQEIHLDVEYGDDSLSIYLVTASIDFTGTQMSETRGSSTLSMHESWRAVLEGDTRSYLGIIPINIDNQFMTMLKSGADKWRCELLDEYQTVLNIEFLAENIIRVTEHRLAVISGGSGIEYDNVMTFRKK